MNEPTRLMSLYFDGMLEGDGFEQLCRWIGQCPANAQQFARASFLHSYTQIAIREHEVRQFISDAQNPPLDFELDGERVIEAVSMERHAPSRHASMANDDREQRTASDEPLHPRFDADADDRAPVRYIVIPRYLFYGGIAALIAVTLLLIGFFSNDNLPQESATTPMARSEPVPESLPLAPPVAVLVEAVDAQWEGASLAPGDPLAPGEYRLLAGFARIALRDGASLIIASPSAVEIQSQTSVRLQQGRLVGRCDNGNDFTVETPNARIVDRGTEFGVAVDDQSQTQLLVFEGEVEVNTTIGEPRNRRIKAGYAAHVSNTGMLSDTFAHDAEHRSKFVSSMPRSIYDAAIARAGAMANWRMDRIDDASVSDLTGNGFDLKVVGELSVVGAEGRKAIYLDGAQGHLEGHALAEALRGSPAYTVEVLVRPSYIHHGSIVSILQEAAEDSERPRRTAMLLELGGLPTDYEESELGMPEQVRFAHRSPASQSMYEGHELNDPQRYAAGQWLHIVAVKEREQMVLYVDGRRAAAVPSDTGMAMQANRLHIGALWPDDQKRGRTFIGLIDRVVVYPHALSAEQVGTHYRLVRDMHRR